jgi:hypothetical protein
LRTLVMERREGTGELEVCGRPGAIWTKREAKSTSPYRKTSEPL